MVNAVLPRADPDKDMQTSSRDPPSPNSHPAKRKRHSSGDPAADHSPSDEQPSPDGLQGDGAGPQAAKAAAASSSNFRNVSACNRCRLRKNRCDQKLPSCNSCAKAGVACVGYDPITKKQIPRR